MRTSIVGGIVAATLLNAAKAEGSEVAMTTEDGTMISQGIKDKAYAAIEAMWQIHEQVVNVSAMVLDTAKLCVKEAKGDAKLAYAKFKAAIADAEAHLLTLNGKDKRTRARIEEEFLASGSNWKQYVSNVGSAVKDGFDISRVKSESALRAQRKAARDATKSRESLKAKVSDLDLTNVTEEEFSEALADAQENAKKSGESVEQELRQILKDDLGVQPVKLDPEAEAKRLFKETGDIASKYIVHGIDTATMRPRECLASVIRACAVIDMNEHGEDVGRILMNTVTQLGKLIPKETQETKLQGRAIPADKAKGTTPAPQPGVANL